MFPFVFRDRVTFRQQRRSGIRLDKQKWGEVVKVIKIQEVILVLRLKGPRSTGRLRARLQSHRPQWEVEPLPLVRAQRRRCKLTGPSPIKHHWLIPSKLLNLPKHQSNMYFVTMSRPFLLLDCFVSKKGQDQPVQ